MICPECKEELGQIVPHLVQCSSVDLSRFVNTGFLTSEEKDFILNQRNTIAVETTSKF